MKLGTDPLDNPRHERFCHLFVRHLQAGAEDPSVLAYREAFSVQRTKVGGIDLAARTMRSPGVGSRIKHLLNESEGSRFVQQAFQKDQVERGLIEVYERCMAHRRVRPHPDYENRTLKPCAACEGQDPGAWCASCVENYGLIEELKVEGGVFSFDPRNALQALSLLGKERGMFVEKKQVEHLSSIDHLSHEDIIGLMVKELSEAGYAVSKRVGGSANDAAGVADAGDQEVRAASEAGGVSPTRIH